MLVEPEALESCDIDYYDDVNLSELYKSVWDGSGRDLKFWIDNDLEFRLPDEIPELNDPLPVRAVTPEAVDAPVGSEVEQKEKSLDIPLSENSPRESLKAEKQVFKKPATPARKQRSSPELSIREVKPKNKPESFENRGAPSFGHEWKPDYRNRMDYRSRKGYGDNRNFPNRKVPYTNTYRNGYSKELTRGGSDIRQKYKNPSKNDNL